MVGGDAIGFHAIGEMIIGSVSSSQLIYEPVSVATNDFTSVYFKKD